MKLCIVAFAAVAFLAFSESADAKDLYVYAKAGALFQKTSGDDQACVSEAMKTPANHISSPISLNPVNAVAGGLIVGLINGRRDARAWAESEDACMEARGYSIVKLLDGEVAALNQLTTPPARAAWFDTFLAQDLTTRAPPVLPPLPVVQSEPYAFGGVRLDPTTLRAMDGTIVSGGVLATVTASHRLTGRITQGPDWNQNFQTGWIFHYTEAFDDNHVLQSYWCGPFRLNRFGNSVACLQRRHRGLYRFQTQRGQVWLITPDVDIEDNIEEGWFTIEASSTDLLGSLPLQLKVENIRRDRLDLDLIAERDGAQVKIWSGRLTLDQAGQATLPLWNQRLVISREGAGVTARLVADGDGHGLQPQ